MEIQTCLITCTYTDNSLHLHHNQFYTDNSSYLEYWCTQRWSGIHGFQNTRQYLDKINVTVAKTESPKLYSVYICSQGFSIHTSKKKAIVLCRSIVHFGH